MSCQAPNEVEVRRSAAELSHHPARPVLVCVGQHIVTAEAVPARTLADSEGRSIRRQSEPDRAPWYFSETGLGRPLILLHGIGMSHGAWNALVPYLSLMRRVIAFDIAGFGRTPPLPRGTLPTIANLVDRLDAVTPGDGHRRPG